MRIVECTEYEWTGGKRNIKGVVTGKFHQWGADYEEFDTGTGNYSVAIVELDGGLIKTFLPTDIKFVE